MDVRTAVFHLSRLVEWEVVDVSRSYITAERDVYNSSSVMQQRCTELTGQKWT